jgi:hypothetical protein
MLLLIFQPRLSEASPSSFSSVYDFFVTMLGWLSVISDQQMITAIQSSTPRACDACGDALQCSQCDIIFMIPKNFHMNITWLLYIVARKKFLGQGSCCDIYRQQVQTLAIFTTTDACSIHHKVMHRTTTHSYSDNTHQQF